MLNFVFGRSATGKTTYLLDKIESLALTGEKKLMIIVPDQSSFDTEKILLQKLGPGLSRDVKVFGFSRLCDYIFEKTSPVKGMAIDDGTRNVILSIAIDQVRDKLLLYGEKAHTKDVLLLMSHAVKEYKKCGVKTSRLREIASNVDDEMLRQKLEDTALVSDAYDAVLENTYIDPLDSISLACDKLKESKLFEGYTIAVDSYSGFTYTEQKIIEQLLIQSKDFYVSLVYDRDGDEELFFVTKRTKRILSDMAKRQGVTVAAPVVLNKHFRKSEQIALLDSNLFSGNQEVYEGEADDISLFVADNIYKEVEYISCQIKKLVFEKGYSFGDIAVIVRDLPKYQSIISQAFKNYDIFYFMDESQDIKNKPLVKLIMACFEAVVKSYPSSKILEILKSRLTDIDDDLICEFENYVFMWNINGKRFLSEFCDNPRGFSESFSDDDKQLLKRLNEVREKIILPLQSFKEAVKEADGRQITCALYKLLQDYNVEENILKYYDCLEKNENTAYANEQIKLWDTLMDILDKTVCILDKTVLSAKRYSELLMMQIECADISDIPQTFDSVTVGEADRIRLSNKKAVFVAGAIEGEFPRTPVSSGVFSDSERRILLSQEVRFDDDIEKLSFHEKLLAYCALTSAYEKLFVSFYTSSLSGEALSPSEIVEYLTSTFKNIKTQDKFSLDFCDTVWTKKNAFSLCAENFYSTDIKYQSLKAYLSNDNKYGAKIEKLSQATKRKAFAFNDDKNAKKLFGDNMNVSATQIEKYYLCRFSYFCQYGLRAKERKRVEIDALEYGTLVHYLLENFLKTNDKQAMSNLSYSDIERFTGDLLEQYLVTKLGGRESKSDRFLYLFERIKNTAVELIKRLVDEFLQSEFSPVDFELKIGGDIDAYKIMLSENNSVTIYGSVDRVDLCELDGEKYIRVVDYKTGPKKFALSDVLYGLNLQMLIYLSAIIKNGKAYFGGEITPAGVLYMPAISPVINGYFNMTDEKIKEEKDSELVMDGLVLDDKRVIHAMEKSAQNVYIPIKLCDDKLKKGKDNIASLEMFGAIFKKLEDLVAQMGENLTSGQIEALPAKSGKYDACRFCPYKDVCGFDEEESQTRDVSTLDKASIKRMLEIDEEE